MVAYALASLVLAPIEFRFAGLLFGLLSALMVISLARLVRDSESLRDALMVSEYLIIAGVAVVVIGTLLWLMGNPTLLTIISTLGGATTAISGETARRKAR